jgi:hypothetical protein
VFNRVLEGLAASTGERDAVMPSKDQIQKGCANG